jgi:DNA helicase II / ATP-dependent DNA helicase PcrA
MTDILQDLTPAQQEAVKHINGPLLVVAGPGSGKTRVITRRVAHLLYCGIKPWNILAITFTNKASAEMRERVEALTTHKGLWLSTFHAFAARTLREFADRVGYGKDFVIYDADDSRKTIADIMKEMEIPKEEFNPRAVQAAISTAKEQFTRPDEFAEGADDYASQIIARVYKRYDERLRKANAFDFDDLLMKLAQLLQTDSQALEKMRERHKFVLVDEFQDTSRSQYIIARLITQEHRNLCVTGDPDQSIYGWRGADINNILDFEKDYPEAKLVFLDRNYRSTQTIVNAANSMVSHNTQRKDRTLYTENVEGEKISVVQCYDSKEEAASICRTATQLVGAGVAPKDIAIFYRVNALSREIEEAFVKAGVPYQVVGGVAFYGRKEVKDILSYMRVAANPADETSLLRIINVPTRGVGPKAIETLRQWAAEHGVTLLEAVKSHDARESFSAKIGLALRALAGTIANIADAGAKGAKVAVDVAIKSSGYEAMLKSAGMSESERSENLEELVNAAAQYDVDVPDGLLSGFLERTALVGDIDTWHDRENKVTLMTMHAAKGLEFPAVIIAGLEEGLLPHSNAENNPTEVEEERRVFFVAMTRAKEKLYLFRSENRMVHGMWRFNVPSRFLRDIPEELLADDWSQSAVPGPNAAMLRELHARRDAATARITASLFDAPRPPAVPQPASAPVTSLPGVGAKVKHEIFGIGVIRAITPSVSGTKATILFQGKVEKKVMLEKAGLQIVGQAM